MHSSEQKDSYVLYSLNNDSQNALYENICNTILIEENKIQTGYFTIITMKEKFTQTLALFVSGGGLYKLLLFFLLSYLQKFL